MQYPLWGQQDGHVLLSQLMSLPFVFETDAMSTESLAQTAGSPTAPGYPLHQEHEAPASVDPLGDTEVLLFGLKSGTSYQAVVYSQAADGTEGQPRAIRFKTGVFEFIKRLFRPEFLAQSLALCDSERPLASHVVLLSHGVFQKRFWTEQTRGDSS